MAQRKKAYPWEKKYPEGLTWAELPAAQHVASILESSARRFPDRPALNFFNRITTYRQLDEQVCCFAKGLQKYGVKKGMKVGLLLPNCPHYVIAYFALLKLGAVVVNYNPLYTMHELSSQVQDSKTQMMITLNLRALYEKTSNLLRTTCLEKVVVGNFEGSLPSLKSTLFKWFKKNEIAAVHYGAVNASFEELMENNGKYRPADIVPETDTALIQYTGGTTGVPKGAILTHANVYMNAWQCSAWMGAYEGFEEGHEKIIAVLPFFHVFSMTAVLLLGIYNGFELILHPRLDLLALLKDIHRKKPTLMPGVPTLFSAICNHRHVKRYKLSSLKACISGGAPLPLEVKTRFEEISHSHLFEGYGLTEASPVACVNPIGEHSKDRSIGLPLPGTVIEIRSTEGRHPLVEKGKIGEICITGPQVMQGYLNHEEETKKTLISGRLHTGDLGYIDSEGYVFVVDRLKEVIITSGFNVYPREIEELLYQHPLITEAAVIGIEDEHRGQAIKAFIVPRLGETLTEDEVRRYLRGKLTKYKIPSIIEFPSDLPKTLIGKIEKKKLS